MSVATSYANALFLAARESKLGAEGLQKLEEQMDRFAAILESSKEARTALLSPAVNFKEREGVVTALAKEIEADALMTRFLSLLARKGRLGLLSGVREAFSGVRLAEEGGVRGLLVAAEKVAEADVASLAQAFARKLGKKVAFRVSTDPELLAGMKVTVNGVTYDGSLRAQLSRMRESFSRGFGANGSTRTTTHSNGNA